jgi:hypothetical protein
MADIDIPTPSWGSKQPDGSQLFKGQTYRPLSVEPYTKPSGGVVPLTKWQSTCPDCGKSFVCSTIPWNSRPNRRCGYCKTPRKRCG